MISEKARNPKIVLWDIETSLMVTTTFTLYPDRIPHDGILQDWYLICGAWKTLGEKKVSHAAITKAGDDKALCKALREALLGADVIVHHNGDKFDIKKLNARLIYHKLPPLPIIPTVDTLKEAKKIAQFSSNRLDYLGKYLFGAGKMDVTPGLWMEILRGNLDVIPKMVRYNKIDVVRLEQLYMRLRPYMKGHPKMNLYSEGSRLISCQKCSSKDVKKNGIRITAGGVKKQEYQCQSCGAYHTTPIPK